MPSRRDLIRMSEREVADFLGQRQPISVASNGRDGWPHVVALWFVMRDGDPWIWTYGKSQKIVNLERDPRATLMAEDGERYDELRGVMIKAEAEIVRDYDQVKEIGIAVYEKYSPDLSPDLFEAVEKMVAEQSRKRVAVRFAPVRVTSWDHRKL